MPTLGEVFGPAMEITDQDKADQYFDTLVEMLVAKGYSRERAEHQQRDNLACYAAHCNEEVEKRVNRLFRCKFVPF